MAQLGDLSTGRVQVGRTVGATEGAVEPARRSWRRVLTALTRPWACSWVIALITSSCSCPNCISSPITTTT